MGDEIAVDIDEIRQRIVEFRESDDEYFDNWVSATTVELICDEIERLRARVTALELERQARIIDEQIGALRVRGSDAKAI